MLPTLQTKLRRACACRSDLLDNGIDVRALDVRAGVELVRRNLDYFQAMLGYDAGVKEVISLLRLACRSAGMGVPRRPGDDGPYPRADARPPAAAPGRLMPLRAEVTGRPQ